MEIKERNSVHLFSRKNVYLNPLCISRPLKIDLHFHQKGTWEDGRVGQEPQGLCKNRTYGERVGEMEEFHAFKIMLNPQKVSSVSIGHPLFP